MGGAGARNRFLLQVIQEPCSGRTSQLEKYGRQWRKECRRKILEGKNNKKTHKKTKKVRIIRRKKGMRVE